MQAISIQTSIEKANGCAIPRLAYRILPSQSWPGCLGTLTGLFLTTVQTVPELNSQMR